MTQLRKDFDWAAQSLPFVLPAMDAETLRLQKGFDIGVIPKLNSSAWQEQASYYAFAANRPGWKYPGYHGFITSSRAEAGYRHLTEIYRCSADERYFLDFVSLLQKGLAVDGFQRLETVPKLPISPGNMIAFFAGPGSELKDTVMRANGILMPALRRDGDEIVWAYKDTLEKINICLAKDDAPQKTRSSPDSIFDYARRAGMNHFGGFWLHNEVG